MDNNVCPNDTVRVRDKYGEGLIAKVPYCRFGIFFENFMFAKSIKRHISDVKNSRLRLRQEISINDRVILLFREGFIFAKLSFAKIKSSQKFPNLQYL